MKKTLTQGGILIGEWWLLALFTILIVQSVYGLFFPLPDGSGMDSIDVVFRTSEAAIFGYIISGNFGRRQSKQQSTTTDTADVTPPSIGFDTQDTAIPQASTTTGKRTVPTDVAPTTTKTAKKSRSKRKNTHQLTLVGIIGVVSLLILIAWRNFYGSNGLATTNMTAVITQYRDMVSGCVGFLIGQPQATASGENDV